MRIIACIALGLAWSAAHAPAAEQQFDPAARAKAIAPFVDEQTLAVVHIDLARVDLDPLVAKLTELLPDAKEDLVAAKPRMAQSLAGLLRAGATNVYLVFTLAFFPQQPLFGVIPLGPGADEKAIVANLGNPNAGSLRVGDALLVTDREETLQRVRQLKPDPRPEIAAAFEAAGDTAVQVLLLPPAYYRRVIEETMPELPQEIGGGPSTILTRGALWAVAGIDLPPKMALRLLVKSQDAQSAAALNAKWNELIRLAAQWKEIRGVVPDFDQAASLLTPKVEGDRLAVAINDDEAVRTLWNAGGRALIAATKGPRQAARRTQSANNLKQIALAMHHYHDANKCFPPQAIYGPDGKPLLSWRVLILPYLDQDQLYQQFRLNEPWDGPHNRALIEKMPSVYRSPGSKLNEKGRTNYVVSVGPQTVFHGRQGTPIKDITDGTSNTIMVVECDDPHAPIWTKPDDLAFDPKDPMRGLGHLITGGFNAAMCDGSVRFVPVTAPPETLRALFTKAGGEPPPGF